MDQQGKIFLGITSKETYAAALDRSDSTRLRRHN